MRRKLCLCSPMKLLLLCNIIIWCSVWRLFKYTNCKEKLLQNIRYFLVGNLHIYCFKLALTSKIFHFKFYIKFHCTLQTMWKNACMFIFFKKFNRIFVSYFAAMIFKQFSVCYILYNYHFYLLYKIDRHNQTSNNIIIFQVCIL